MTILGRETWGPALWIVLHILAQKSGTLENSLIIKDDNNDEIGGGELERGQI